MCSFSVGTGQQVYWMTAVGRRRTAVGWLPGSGGGGPNRASSPDSIVFNCGVSKGGVWFCGREDGGRPPADRG